MCTPFPTADWLDVEGRCFSYGLIPTGGECEPLINNPTPEASCASFFCLWFHCSEMCGRSSDCPDGMVCARYGFELDEAGDVVVDIGMCRWLDGSQAECSSDADCPAGEACVFYLTPGSSVAKICTTWTCDPADPGCVGPGERCVPGVASCYSGLCQEANPGPGWCAALCASTEDCPAGMTCGSMELEPGLSTDTCLP